MLHENNVVNCITLRARGTPVPTVNVILPKVNARNKATKAITAPVVARPDKEGPPHIVDLDNKEKAPITADIKSNIDGESPNNGGGMRSGINCGESEIDCW